MDYTAISVTCLAVFVFSGSFENGIYLNTLHAASPPLAVAPSVEAGDDVLRTPPSSLKRPGRR